MMLRGTLLVCGAALLIAGSPAVAKSRPSDPVRAFDTDHDGTLDYNEVKNAASALFERLDRDHDGTLDRRELRRRLNGKELGAADPDHEER